MTTNEFLHFSNYFQWVGSFTILLFSAYFYKSSPREIRLLGAYGLNSVLFQLIQSNYKILGLHPNAVGNTYVFTEVFLLLLLYYWMLRSKLIKRIVVVAFVLFVVFFAFNVLNDFTHHSGPVRAARDGLLIFFSVMYFFQLLKQRAQHNLFDSPMFWSNTAILIYFSCTFMLSLFSNYIVKVLLDDFSIFWSFRNFLRTGFCILICFGIWTGRKSYPYLSKNTISRIL